MIKATSEVLAAQFIVWSLAKYRSPWSEDLHCHLDEFLAEVYGETVTEGRKARISERVFEAHHNFLLDLCDHSLKQVEKSVARFAPAQYGLHSIDR
ncbi:hypothetical protein KUW19_00675 [Ferrimonas balearica]|uniref:hypothetical protein n=1 Tax=Ferrimonas balearica TaxID=44012 RepID=UPI001C98C157|nr:hypothetical protein [Ferrimonas balearica]MBY6104990.1 hypothetical protein [Ferrimonas balearica]